MKRIYYAIILAAMIVSCQPKTKTVPFNPADAKQDLTKTIDRFYQAYNSKDSTAFFAFMADDGLYCGTDATEFWDKATYSKLMTKMFADTSFSPDISIDKREIRIDKDGNSAIVIDQFFTGWSKQIPMRNVFHLIKTENKWMCDFSSISLIPDNKDLNAIFNSVK